MHWRSILKIALEIQPQNISLEACEKLSKSQRRSSTTFFPMTPQIRCLSSNWVTRSTYLSEHLRSCATICFECADPGGLHVQDCPQDGLWKRFQMNVSVHQ